MKCAQPLDRSAASSLGSPEREPDQDPPDGLGDSPVQHLPHGLVDEDQEDPDIELINQVQDD